VIARWDHVEMSQAATISVEGPRTNVSGRYIGLIPRLGHVKPNQADGVSGLIPGCRPPEARTAHAAVV